METFSTLFIADEASLLAFRWRLAEAIAWVEHFPLPAAHLPSMYPLPSSYQRIYHADWLGTLWQGPGMTSPEEYIARGWGECLAILDRLDAALAAPDRTIDPCLLTGEGWIAEEAFATGLLCFLLYPADPLAALRRASVTADDSDSIACLTGAFAGAHLGLAAWTAD